MYVPAVHVFDCVQLRAVCSWHAHEAALAALAWSADGTRLATASERGTVIRVFSVPDPVRYTYTNTDTYRYRPSYKSLQNLNYECVTRCKNVK